MKFMIRIILVGLIFLVTACPSSRGSMQVETATAKQFIIKFSSGAEKDLLVIDKRAKIKSVTFTKKILGVDQLLWEIKSSNPAGNVLQKLIYGELPVGFRTAKKAVPLSSGDKIIVDTVFYTYEVSTREEFTIQ